MHLVAFSVRDMKAEIFHQPFFCLTRGVGIRVFTEACGNLDHDFGKYPEDFVLFEVGKFDQSRGVLDAFSAPTALGSGLDFQRPADNGSLKEVKRSA